MKKSIIKPFLFSSLVMIGFSSCLKENEMTVLDPDVSPTVVEFANTGDNVAGTKSQYPRFTTDLGSLALGDTYDINVNVSYNGPEAAPGEITVSVEVDAEALIQFNTENGTSYEVPPADVFTLPASVVIPKGQRIGQAVLTIKNTSNFDFNANYAIPLKIKSVSSGTPVSRNFSKAVYSFSARNSYDGIYHMDATAPMVDLTSSSLTGWYDIDMQLITYTGNSVALYDGFNYVDAYGHPIISGGTSGSYYGSFSPVFFFESDGTISSVTNYYGQESGGNKRSAILDPTGVNKATFNSDGSIKSFEVSYIMTQSLTAPFAPRTYFHEKFTYVEPR